MRLQTFVFTAVACLLVTSQANAVLIGPAAYTSVADSPIAGIAGFMLEDMEDDLFDLANVTASGINLRLSSTFGNALVDSVDADNGPIDGNGQRVDGMGQAYWASGSPGFTFNFVADLPTHVGVVWTDGAGLVSFRAWDAADVLIAESLNNAHADGNFVGGTAEDRFYGASNAAGVARMQIWNSSGGIEVDHIQFAGRVGAPPPANVSEPGTLGLLGLGLLGLGFARRKRA
jgi:hypothetical protein